MCLRCFALAVYVFSGLSIQAVAQNTPAGSPTPGAAVTTPKPGSVSAATLYRFFFRHLGTLEAQATTLDSQGVDGSDLRNYVQTTLVLTDQEAGLVKQYAATCLAAVQQIDQQAQAIYQQIAGTLTRPGLPPRAIPVGSALPATDSRLTQLTQLRDNVTTAQVTALQAALASSTFQRLDNYVKTEFATQVITVPIIVNPPTSAPAGSATTGGRNQ
jgi:hypothetical protein